MFLIREAILLQKKRMKSLYENVDFYKIKDPVFNKLHMQILIKNQVHQQTKLVADHFMDDYYLDKIKNKNYDEIKSEVINKIIFYVCLAVSSLTLLVFTFSLLEFRSLSFIPFCSLFIFAFILVVLIFQYFRLMVINKVVDNEYKIDKDFLMLIKKMNENNHQKTVIDNNNEIKQNVDQNENEKNDIIK
jgi:hypothetical protein